VGGLGIGVDGAIAIGRWRQRALKGFFFQDGGERKPLWYDGRKEESNMTNTSCGWGQLNALGCVIRCDLTYFPVTSMCRTFGATLDDRQSFNLRPQRPGERPTEKLS
jgi:hypothetical protein